MRELKPIAKVTARIADKTKAAPKRKKVMIRDAQAKKGKRFV